MADFSIADLVDAMPYARRLGIVVDVADADRVVGHLDWDESLCTAGGILHGGSLMSLGDTIGAVCAFLNLPEGASTATTSSNTQLLRAVREGTVIASARPLHRGRTTIVVQTSLTDAQDRLVAQVTQTQAVLGVGRTA
ncbi:PaaI family thioesterase [Nocardioidaceae bacterium SCSIO 66511]|nr:PaaI family thioesterase [Nocardioidaceae bacterium SCSIO 66511]